METDFQKNGNNGLSFLFVLITGVVLSFFILVGLISFRYIQNTRSPKHKNIESLLKNKKYTEALSILQEAESDNENRPSHFLQRGKIWYLLALKREDVTRWKNYGINEKDWFDSKEAQKAEHYFQKTISLDEKSIDGHLFLGILYMKKGWYSSAETEFLSILRIDKEHSHTRLNLGILYTKMDRYNLAEEELMYAYGLSPSDQVIVKNLALLYRFYLNRPDSAIVWTNRYLNMNPRKDINVSFIRKDLTEMLIRYPEYQPYEPCLWKKKQRFQMKQRKK